MGRILKIITVFYIIVIIIILCFGIKQHIDEKEYLESDEYKNLMIKREQCDHEYVTTGSGQGRSLRVYAKCIKCGKELY